MRIRPLRRSELPRNTLKLARYLIGKTLTHNTPQGRLIGRSVRIGISKETHRLWRFYERGNPCVSGPKKLNT